MVISVIAILAGLLLPSFSRAKQGANSARCKSNLRQIAIALQGYVHDTGAYPLHYLITKMAQPQEYARWHTDLKPYLGQDWFDPIYQCPGYKQRSLPNSGATSSAFGGYGYNQRGVTISSPPSFGLGGWTLITEGQPCRESAVINPSDMIALGDCVLGGIYTMRTAGGPIEEAGGTDRFSPADWRTVVARVRPLAIERERKRHSGTYNVAFCDGHIDNLKTNSLFSTDTTVLKRWNYDNEPHREQLQ